MAIVSRNVFDEKLLWKQISTEATDNFIRHLKNCFQDSLLCTFSGTTYFKIRMKFVAARWASHQHTTNILWIPQPLATFGAYFLSRISHHMVITLSNKFSCKSRASIHYIYHLQVNKCDLCQEKFQQYTSSTSF